MCIRDREYFLECTDKFYEYYSMKTSYVKVVLDRLRERVDKKDIETLENILDIMSNELMPEVTNFINERQNEKPWNNNLKLFEH